MDEIHGATTLPAFFAECAAKFRDRVYLWENTGNGYRPCTYGETEHQVRVLAGGLIALGIGEHERVALLSEARNHWIISELAILTAGAVNVPLSVRIQEPSELIFRIGHAGADTVIVSGNHLDKIRAIRHALPGLKRVIVLDEPEDREPGEMLLGEVLALGAALLDEDPGCVSRRVAAVSPSDPANISYTSGTTSDPKGIILTHGNYVTNVRQAYSLMDITPDFVTLLMLPWDHAFAHTAGLYCFMGKGASVASVQAGKTTLESLKNLPRNIREIRPYLLYSVPAIAANFRRNIEKGVEARGGLSPALFRAGLTVAYCYNGNGFDRGTGWKALLKPAVLFFDWLVFRKVREVFGGRLRFFIGGGALLDVELQRFFYAIGIPMLQGYGLTEASPLISANSLQHHKLGSSGRIVEGLEAEIRDDQGNVLPSGERGEIVIRGGNVMAGYWNNPEASAEVLRNGWLHTGDMGYIDRDGYLFVLGRFKSLLIADDGEKYSPEGMEEAVTGHSQVIAQCMLYNNQHPYTVAVVSPSREKLLAMLREHHAGAAEEERITASLKIIAREFQEYRTGGRLGHLFPQRWLPAAIAVISEGFTEENQMLNFQFKVVRGRVAEHFSDRIRYLYTPAGKQIDNEPNRQALRELLSN